VKAALKYLQQASIDYGKALDQQPGEKNFLEPQNRIKAALAHYTDLAQANSKQPETASSASSPGSQPPPADDGTLTNNDVIAMVKNLDEANVLDTIQTSPKVQFDLSPQGQIQLARGGVDGKIIIAMKQRARGVSPTTHASNAPTTRR
jgi:hypothetical protein